MQTTASLAEDKIFLVVSTDVLGKEDELGKILIKAFFETMRSTGDYPHTIFFLNAGVRLTTLDVSVIPILKELKENGVEIFSCGTCLKFYGLESQLKVGAVGSILQTVEAMKKYKVVWA
jgi:selenium metabolism protein YedF